MPTSASHHLSENEKSIDSLYSDTANLKTFIYYTKEEMEFLQKLVSADIYMDSPNLFEQLQEYHKKLEKYTAEADKWNETLDKHKNEISGILECDDVNCEIFYDEKHDSLKKKIINFLTGFNDLKLEIFKHTGNIFKN